MRFPALFSILLALLCVFALAVLPGCENRESDPAGIVATAPAAEFDSSYDDVWIVDNIAYYSEAEAYDAIELRKDGDSKCWHWTHDEGHGSSVSAAIRSRSSATRHADPTGQCAIAREPEDPAGIGDYAVPSVGRGIVGPGLSAQLG